MTDKQLGGVGSYVIFENEHVKVWQNDLQSGESSDWHHHDMHYLFVATTPGELEAEFEDGTTRPNHMDVGKVVMGRKDSTHQLRNVGGNPYSSVIIEIKQ
jgi:quercetin dioxygenase-like cupin family protein